MAIVHVYGRETTFRRLSDSGDFVLSSPIYSFDEIPDPKPDKHANDVGLGMSFELGRRFTIDIEVPGEKGLVDLSGAGSKYVVTPDGKNLDVFDVIKNLYNRVKGYSVGSAKWHD